MFRQLFPIVFLVAATAYVVPATAQLDGAWRVVEGTMDGQAIPSNWLASMKLTINQSNFSAVSGNLTSAGTIQGDAFGQVKKISFQIAEGADKGNTIHGIYKIESGKLTIAYSRSGSAPGSFVSTPDNKNLTLVYSTDSGSGNSSVAGNTTAPQAPNAAAAGTTGTNGSGGSAAFQ